MTPSPIIQTAWRVLDLILQDELPTDATLAQALDDLALAYHDTPEGTPAPGNQDPPARDQAALRAIIGARFPDFGFYTVMLDPLDMDMSGDKIGVGDAIDDLVDIAGDLAEAVWRFDHLGAGDAYWFLHLLHYHWGRHMRDLSLYLHARRFR